MTNPAHTLDAIGLLCPLPVLKARKALQSLPAGEMLEILADDKMAQVDLPLFCQQSGHELLSQTDHGTHQRYVICKATR